jgi:hypothetical protein
MVAQALPSICCLLVTNYQYFLPLYVWYFIQVQRPSIGESIAVDMLLLRRLMGVVDRNVTQVSCSSTEAASTLFVLFHTNYNLSFG